ncbi:phenylalanyl-tRNA synthetase beta subunit [Geosporobacter subterraneus DSM 17957]|uniref:Phenylalanine--tRNA ligase beta subunit n=1 Tax=Geosporobacter subterraneus DSM 17957 TaxID=1121919 RepID=A0A1M6MQ68_9FIRM|nr:phenylalanine--tRNA ligase subunit beta [Geosporobacter subterraneus]SHJ85559.1 phenylalanyl-tRNA synthetase beta subunit [Geosporobacter subterraneus DSM 17957]
MFVPVKWLREYVNIDDVDINTLSDRLVMSGSKVEAVEHLGEEIKGVVVGKILEMNPHPNADKLLVTKVDVGTEVIQIVTGANNIKVGDYIPIVMAGGELPGGVKIKKGKLRGEESNGMMCSAKELGIADKVIPQYQKDGIFILDQAYPLGEDIKKVLGLEGYVIEFEITPNRPDCLSMLGIARETAATFNCNMQYPDVKIAQEHGNIEEYASIEVESPELCGRYVGRVATDLVIQPSPMWLQQRLMGAGVRPINNIVDITNYVMLEMGQPLHAFDLDQLADRKIIVRKAAAGEVFQTLDGVQRNLDDTMLMIADGKRSVGLAGVMGGENSEVTEQTKSILIESAYFHPDNIRTTSKKLGLRTEASARFEKGIDPNGCRLAADRVCQLIEELGAGRIVKGTIDIYPEPVEKKVIEIRPQRINNLLGISLAPDEIKDILTRLELEVTIESNIMKATVPTYRADLLKEIDIVEEVARIYGYDEIPNTVPKGNTQGAKTNGQIIEDYSKDVLNGLGLNEITTYSFVSPKSFDMIRIAEDSFMRNVVKLINPLGEENSIMRTTLMANMLEVLARNYSRKVESAKAFELGRVFIPLSVPVDRLPVEKKILTLGMYGKGTDFYTLKGTIEELLTKLGIEKCQYIPEKNHPTFHPGRCANILYGDHILGVLGEIHPDVAENYDIDERTYIAELDFNILLQITRLDRLYKPLPKYPAITRDMALVLEDHIYVKQIEDIIWSNGGTTLESVKLFDVYKGKQIQEGYKSVAYSLTYRAADRTLVDEEVNQIHDKIVRALEEELKAQLRK